MIYKTKHLCDTYPLSILPMKLEDNLWDVPQNT